MADELTNQPQPTDDDFATNGNGADADRNIDQPVDQPVDENAAPPAAVPAPTPPQPPTMPEDEMPTNTPNQNESVNAPANNNGGEQGYDDRLERLGGEPAPVITPDEFARLQKAGQVHIDARGRVRTTRREDADGGVSLRKRRAWYR